MSKTLAQLQRPVPWYVIQVQTGKELAMCMLIDRVLPNGVVYECFTPRYETQIKKSGTWINTDKNLLPGYVIVATNCVDTLSQLLKTIPEFTRLLKMGDSFIPLAEDDRAWIDAFTNEGDRCVGMSMGVMEGDRVKVVSGPLRNHEALIKSVNRHRSLAYVELEICGRRVTTKVGLGIVGRKEDISAVRGERPRCYSAE